MASFPLARISRNDARHIGFQLRCNTHLVPADHAFLYIANRTDLPDRSLLSNLSAVEKLEAAHRMALLTTGAVVEGEDPGPLVCSCFAADRNTIRRAVEEHKLTDARQVRARLRAGTNCGSCPPEIKALLRRWPVRPATKRPYATYERTEAVRALPSPGV